MRKRRGWSLVRPINRDSDLIGIPVAGGAILAILAILAAFFFIGPIAGIVVSVAVIALSIVLIVRVIKANELS